MDLTFKNVLISAGFAILAVAVLALIEFVTLLAYFRLRQKHPERKFMNEVVIMGSTIALSFIARFLVAIVYLADQNGLDAVWDGAASGLFALYALIGGLTFEGTYAPDELMSVMQVGWQILYYGALAYAGITMLVVTSTCVSYEVYSFFKVGCFLRKFEVVYIFTDVTEESVIMAMDIEDKEKTLRRHNKYAIIFMSNELESFDRKNELHSEIMDRGYIYWSYGKVGDKEKEISLIKKLNYSQRNCAKRDKGRDRHKMVHIFAMSNDEKLCAAENRNSDAIFNDIYSVMLDYCKCLKNKDTNNIPTVVNYYLLTHGDINYEFYNTRISEIVDSFFEKYGIQDAEVICTDGSKSTKKHQILRYIQLHILSEARLTGDDLVNRWQSGFLQNGEKENHDLYRASTMPTNNNVYRLAVFGFGKTGQYALKSIFVATSNVTKEGGKYRSAQFLADVYDVGADKRSGEFSYTHPLFLCKVDGDDHTPLTDDQLIEWGKNASNDALDYIYLRAKESPQNMDRNQVWEDMAFPIIDYHRVSCLRQDFMNKIDSSLGIFDKASIHYNSFVVSMGNDEDNLIMANILIDDFKHEILLKGKPQGCSDDDVITIFVHIRDEKNTHRLNWSKWDDVLFSKCFKVITFGCRENIWSYNNIIKDENASMYNYMYNVKSHAMEIERGSNNVLTPNEQAIMQSLSKGDDAWIAIAKQDELRKDLWLNINSFTKESNRSAFSFALNYRYVNEFEEREYCERVEHLRWNRFHMANGWIYAEYGKSEKAFRRHNKEHTCLCPYDMLDEWIQAYDLVNVQVGKMLELNTNKNVITTSTVEK